MQQTDVTFQQVLQEIGARRGEAFALRWNGVDFVTNTARMTSEKGSKPGIFAISEKLVRMLGKLARTSERIRIDKSSYNLDKGF